MAQQRPTTGAYGTTGSGPRARRHEAQRTVVYPQTQVRPRWVGGDPPGLYVVVEGSTARLYWDPSPTPNVADYSIYRRTPQTGAPFDPIVDTPIATGVVGLTYEDTGLTGGDYDWQVFGRVPPGW